MRTKLLDRKVKERDKYEKGVKKEQSKQHWKTPIINAEKNVKDGE